MDEEVKVATKVIFYLLIKKNSCELYYFHQKYKISPKIIIEALSILKKNDLINIEGQTIKLVPKIDNQKIAIINKIIKTKKPKCLYKTILDI